MFYVFLDWLCEVCMVLEFKDYCSWCNQMNLFEVVVLLGYYVEMWLLFGGQIYCVIGCLYFDGVVVFLFEDIILEILLICKFCVDFLLSVEMLDVFEDVVVVFVVNGEFLVLNW